MSISFAEASAFTAELAVGVLRNRRRGAVSVDAVSAEGESWASMRGNVMRAATTWETRPENSPAKEGLSYDEKEDFNFQSVPPRYTAQK